jgi:hypothetical protein
MPRQVADDPANRVHLPEVFGAFLLGQARQPAPPLAARESELLDRGMGHRLNPHIIRLVVTVDDVRRLAMTLPRTTEGFVGGRVKFYVWAASSTSRFRATGL